MLGGGRGELEGSIPIHTSEIIIARQDFVAHLSSPQLIDKSLLIASDKSVLAETLLHSVYSLNSIPFIVSAEAWN